jgi:hypothetical protein
VQRRFAGVDLGRAATPDETTILRFRHLSNIAIVRSLRLRDSPMNAGSLATLSGEHAGHNMAPMNMEQPPKYAYAAMDKMIATVAPIARQNVIRVKCGPVPNCECSPVSGFLAELDCSRPRMTTKPRGHCCKFQEGKWTRLYRHLSSLLLGMPER